MQWVVVLWCYTVVLYITKNKGRGWVIFWESVVICQIIGWDSFNISMGLCWSVIGWPGISDWSWTQMVEIYQPWTQIYQPWTLYWGPAHTGRIRRYHRWSFGRGSQKKHVSNLDSQPLSAHFLVFDGTLTFQDAFKRILKKFTRVTNNFQWCY